MSSLPELLKTVPTAFISYARESDEHKAWVIELGTRLRSDGIDLTLDEWHLRPGDELPRFMESAIRESDSVLVVCTPAYRAKSDARSGGVGYEGSMITAEIRPVLHAESSFLSSVQASGATLHQHGSRVLSTLTFVLIHTPRPAMTFCAIPCLARFPSLRHLDRLPQDHLPMQFCD